MNLSTKKAKEMAVWDGGVTESAHQMAVDLMKMLQIRPFFKKWFAV